MATVGRLVLFTIFLLVTREAAAQEELKQLQSSNYGKIQTLHHDSVFGDSVSPIGALSIRHSDIVLSGTGPVIEVSRRFEYQARMSNVWNRQQAFADWTFELPRLVVQLPYRVENNVLVPRWEVRGANPQARCSSFGPPPDYRTLEGAHSADKFWYGVNLDIPGQGSQRVLIRSPNYAIGAKPEYRLATNGNWLLTCLPGTKNGAPGEGFLALSPDGEKYWFDWLVALPDGQMNLGNETQTVAEISLAVTRVEDRFGNYVDYNYAPDNTLLSISASDGRRLDFAWVYNGDRANYVTSISERVNSGAGRVWRYEYQKKHDLPQGPWYRAGVLRRVILPDSSSWVFNIDDFTNTCRVGWDNIAQDYVNCINYIYLNGYLASTEFSGSITSPSGAIAKWIIVTAEHYRIGSPSHQPCCMDSPFISVGRVHERSITGPGVSMLWMYWYDQMPENSYTRRVKRPDGLFEATISNNLYHHPLEGQPYKIELARDFNLTDRVQSIEINSARGAVQVGSASDQASGREAVEWAWPVSRNAITRDGTTFVRTNQAFDEFGNPQEVVKSNTLGYSKSENFEYHNDAALWVLGQIKRSATNGIETSRNEHAWKASPTKTYAFGKLQQTIGYYNSTGDLSHVIDGNNNLTAFFSWKRGIPQATNHADGTSQYATVDDSGLVTSIRNEMGAQTCYEYDLMGRLARIVQSSEVEPPVTELGRCDTSTWRDEIITFAPVQVDEHGLGPGHWTQRRRLGNRQVNTYFDALWRPVLEESLDASDVAGTLSQVVKRYDANGRLIFQSYPQRGVGNYLDVTQGMHTEYDALDRVTSVSQDSEQGLLTTFTEYLPNHQTRVIDPRLGQTITSYQVFDQPTYDYPVVILGPTGTKTEIPRDVFGKPLEITRR